MTTTHTRWMSLAFIVALLAPGCRGAKPITLMGDAAPYVSVLELANYSDSLLAGEFELYNMGTSHVDKYRLGVWSFSARPRFVGADVFVGPAVARKNNTPLRGDSIYIVRNIANGKLRFLSGYLFAGADSSFWTANPISDSLIEVLRRPRPGDRYFKE